MQQLSDLGISSLKMVNLMLAVELEFDIAIAQSDITPENFHSRGGDRGAGGAHPVAAQITPRRK